MNNNNIKILSDKDHVLQRPATYIGSMSLEAFEGFIFNRELQKFEYKQYQKIQAFEKIINEILDNAIDEALRTDFKKANVIEVNTDGNYISVKDNGRGVPIAKIIDDKGNKISQLEAAFTRARAGSNFSDDNRNTIGLNGLGSFCTSVFSKEFKVEVKSQDGTGSLICRDNLSYHKCKVKLNKNTGKTYTEVTFIPDYERFGLTCFDENHQNLLFTRLINLSVCYQKIKFKYNGQVLYKIKPETYLTYFGNNFEQISDNDKYIIGILPNDTDNFIHSSYVNGLNIKDGGNHIDFILNELISRLRNNKVFKKYDITPGDIRNKIQLICIMRSFPNMQFNSQTKEKLTNSFAEIREYFKDIDFDRFVNKLVKNEKITEPIIINYKIKKQVKDQLALKNSVKLEKNFKCDKYLPATKIKKRLFITEGDSASGGLTPSLGREENSFFSTRGVPLNAYTATAKELANNEELTNIIKVLNLDINNKENSISHDCIVLAEDADCDGSHIRGLYLGFFIKYARHLFEEHKIKYLKTPIAAILEKRNIVKYWFTLSDMNNYLSKHSIKNNQTLKYFKGLGSWRSDLLSNLINNNGGIENFLEEFEISEDSEKLLIDWIGESKENVQSRKEYLKDYQLDINKV